MIDKGMGVKYSFSVTVNVGTTASVTEDQNSIQMAIFHLVVQVNGHLIRLLYLCLDLGNVVVNSVRLIQEL